MPADPMEAAGVPGLRVGLIGHPLGHSLSPAMQDAAFAAAGLPQRYELLDVAADALPALLATMRRSGWLGCNVTVPYKMAVAPLLDDLHGDAAILGAVNTIHVAGDRLAGYNTDVPGFAADLAVHLDGRAAGSAVVLGAGGSARAVVWALLQAGWDVAVLARHPEQAAALRDALPAGRPVRAGSLAEARMIERLRGGLLVNCTAAGMWPAVDADPLPPEVRLPADLLVYDLVYRPPQTRLLRRAAAAGCRVAGGLGMLVAQGAAAFTIWTGRDAPRAVMLAAAEQALL